MTTYSQNIVPEVPHEQRDTHPLLGFIGNGGNDLSISSISRSNGSYRSSISPILPEYIGYNFKTTQPVVAKYGISAGEQYKDMTAWDFQGSINNSSWTTLHSMSNFRFSTSNTSTTHEWEIKNTTPYKYYRLNVKARPGNNSWGLNRLMLYEKIPDPPTVPGDFTEQPEPSSVNLSGEIVTVQWGGSTQSEGEAVTYTLELYNGSSWASVATGITDTSMNFTFPSISNTNAQFRVKAVASSGASSTYKTSNVFAVRKNLFLINDGGTIKSYRNGVWQTI